jgi:hypothetical protein
MTEPKMVSKPRLKKVWIAWASDEAEQAGQEINSHHRRGGEERGLRGSEVQDLPVNQAVRPDGDDVIDDPLDGPVFEEIEINADDEENQAEGDRVQVRAVIADDAAVEIHPRRTVAMV